MLLLKIKYHLFSGVRKLFYNLFCANIKIGHKTSWRKGFTITSEKGGTIEIGSNCFFNNNCTLASLKKIKIGDNCLFGENVKIYDHNHIFKEKKLIKKQGFSVKEVTIGNNCWICSNVVILKGVTIGDHCIVGAGVILWKDVPSNTIVKNHNSLIFEKIEG